MKKIIIAFAAAMMALVACNQTANVNPTETNMEVNRKVLLVVDLQKDFIDGTLQAANGREIVPVVDSIKNSFDRICFTLDWHPSNHCSFTDFGGIWPVHCVQYTAGASLPDCILTGVSSDKYDVVLKGRDQAAEEYGAFAAEGSVAEVFHNGDEVVVCGIAAEYCVLETLKNIMKEAENLNLKVSVCLDAVAYITEYTPLVEYMKENNIPAYEL
ncbi:MAG: isochorismatase family protein [Bacteroidales bacterium]|nr:isochorismatase family protein [Bacteroidales bacterium]